MRSISPAPARKRERPRGAAGRAAGPSWGGRTRGTAGRAKAARHSARIVCAARRRESACRCGGQAGTRPAGARGKRTGRRRAGIAALAVLLVLAALAGGAYLYVDSLIDRSDLGSFDDVSSPVSTSAEPSIVPPDFAGVRNLLVLGAGLRGGGPCCP